MNATDNQSLLAFLHNWQHHGLPRNRRPENAAPWARALTYLAGAGLLAVILITFARRPRDSGRDLLIYSGLFIGLGFMMNPVVHNYYFLLLLPLATAVLADHWRSSTAATRSWWLTLPPVLTLFTLCDLAARLPQIGPALRDWGLPVLSMLFLMGAGVSVLLKLSDEPNARSM